MSKNDKNATVTAGDPILIKRIRNAQVAKDAANTICDALDQQAIDRIAAHYANEPLANAIDNAVEKIDAAENDLTVRRETRLLPLSDDFLRDTANWIPYSAVENAKQWTKPTLKQRFYGLLIRFGDWLHKLAGAK